MWDKHRRRRARLKVCNSLRMCNFSFFLFNEFIMLLLSDGSCCFFFRYLQSRFAWFFNFFSAVSTKLFFFLLLWNWRFLNESGLDIRYRFEGFSVGKSSWSWKFIDDHFYALLGRFYVLWSKFDLHMCDLCLLFSSRQKGLRACVCLAKLKRVRDKISFIKNHRFRGKRTQMNDFKGNFHNDSAMRWKKGLKSSSNIPNPSIPFIVLTSAFFFFFPSLIINPHKFALKMVNRDLGLTTMGGNWVTLQRASWVSFLIKKCGEGRAFYLPFDRKSGNLIFLRENSRVIAFLCVVRKVDLNRFFLQRNVWSGSWWEKKIIEWFQTLAKLKILK